jgi:hypothetical protein
MLIQNLVSQVRYEPTNQGVERGLGASGRVAACLGYWLMATIVLARPGFAQTAAPPSSLVAMEKEVSLKIAHVRIKGPTNAADLKQLSTAEQIAAQGEKAMAAGDYRGAEQDFLHANVIISAVGD